MSTAMDDNDDLRDEALQRALLHAPDHAAVPNWRLRKAILEQAHEAVMPAAAAPSAQARPWWQRLLGVGAGREGGSRMPWNAAFATVLVAVLVGVLWQREPVPSARPDGEAPTVAPAQRSEAPPAPAPAAPAPSRDAVPPAQPPAPATSELWPGTLVPSPAPDVPATPPAPPPPAAMRAPRATERAAPSPNEAKEARKRETAPALDPTPAPPPSAPPAAAPSADALSRAAPRDASPDKRRLEEESASRQRSAAPAAPAAPSAGTGASPDAAGALAARPAAPPAQPEAGAPPSFAALSQWSRLTITQRGGASRTLSRSEAMDLHALLGSAAISAVGMQPLAGAPEWRVTLERGNGDVMATFELGSSQVRWREGRGPGTTGAPSADSLAALRDALQRAVAAPQPASPPQLQWKPAQPPAEAGTAPTAPSR